LLKGRDVQNKRLNKKQRLALCLPRAGKINRQVIKYTETVRPVGLAVFVCATLGLCIGTPVKDLRWLSFWL
jgi:hypothetical protein